MPDQGIERFTFTESDRNQIEFGPIFQKKFLKEVCVCLEILYNIVQLMMFQVLKLQQKIENLTFSYTETDGVEQYNLTKGNKTWPDPTWPDSGQTSSSTVLFSVCNKPLSPEINECNIQNVLAYWQDNEELLDKTK